MAGLISLLAGFCGCSSEPRAELLRRPAGKILIVCYSESGNQNTLTAAKWIQEQLGGDLYRIRMVKPYNSGSYREVLKESKLHLDNKVRPEILPFAGNVADYDIIFVGSPVWYGTFAPPLGTFFSTHDLAGKMVIPFCTHGGGGAGHLYEDVAQAAPHSKILPGLTLRGSNVVERTIGRGTRDKASPDEVVRWLNQIIPAMAGQRAREVQGENGHVR